MPILLLAGISTHSPPSTSPRTRHPGFSRGPLPLAPIPAPLSPLPLLLLPPSLPPPPSPPSSPSCSSSLEYQVSCFTEMGGTVKSHTSNPCDHTQAYLTPHVFTHMCVYVTLILPYFFRFQKGAQSQLGRRNSVGLGRFLDYRQSHKSTNSFPSPQTRAEHMQKAQRSS